MSKYPEYTEREKNTHINEIEVMEMLEEAQGQLDDARETAIRNAHNIEAVINNIEKAIQQLLKGGGSV